MSQINTENIVTLEVANQEELPKFKKDLQESSLVTPMITSP